MAKTLYVVSKSESFWAFELTDTLAGHYPAP